jgi:dolichyl-phosphate beta-glucosyltransferase
MLAATGEYRVFSDADGSTSLREMDSFWGCFEQGFDVVIGSRSLPESEVLVRQRWYRERMGRIFNMMVKLLVTRDYIDTQCGFKAFTGQAAQEMFTRQSLDGFAFDVELLAIAAARGARVAQLPVRWTNHPQARVNPLTDSTKMFLDLIRIRIKSWLGHYKK